MINQMNFIRLLLLTFIIFLSSTYAAGPPLNVGIEGFNPPFEIQGADNQIYGFDIDMMNALCKIMNRPCMFHVMDFDQLIDSVASRKIDVAVSSITITADRSALVNFSLPYLLSYSRFLGNNTKDNQQPFVLSMLNNKTIGIETGTIFADQIRAVGIINPQIRQYDTMELLVEGLGKKEVGYILFDNPAATYWAANSSGEFIVLGPPYSYGYGFGIAVNKSDKQLLMDINSALLQYQNSEEYKINYNKYLEL